MARVEKVGASLIPEALKMRREMLGIIYERDVESFKGEFSALTEEFFRNGDQTTVLALEGETAVGCATICYIELMPTVDHPGGKRAHFEKKFQKRGSLASLVHRSPNSRSTPRCARHAA